MPGVTCSIYNKQYPSALRVKSDHLNVVCALYSPPGGTRGTIKSRVMGYIFDVKN